MRLEDFDRWADSFAAFHARFGALFARRETRDQAAKYVRGLLAPVERKLYLPKGWCAEPERRQKAKVPAEVVFQTKPEQAIAMLEHAWERGVPMRWVTGDEVYGDAPRLRESVQTHGRWYVLAVSATTPVWPKRPPVEEPGPARRGHPRTN